MSPQGPSVCAVVLTWDNFDDTDECLRSLASQSYARLQIVLVDNGSTDGSRERLQEGWGSRATLLANERNEGVSAGYNRGLRHALDLGAEHILLLNNDIVADPDLAESLLAAFEAEPAMAAVSPVITYFQDPTRIWFAGAAYNRLLGLSRHRHLTRRWQTVTHRRPGLWATDYIPNCAAMISATALGEVGLLDERFFYAHDDIDWGLRARDRGYILRVLGRPLVRHKVSATTGVRGSNVLGSLSAYHTAHGSMLMGAKHARGARIIPYVAGQLLIRAPYYCAQMALHGRVGAVGRYFAGLRDGYRDYLRHRGDA